MAFSTKDRVPVAVEVYYGSMKDISTLKDFLNRYPQRRIGFIFDRGFSSYKLLEELRRENIHYIVKEELQIHKHWSGNILLSQQTDKVEQEGNRPGLRLHIR